LRTLTLTGKVFTGEGNGKKYLSIFWVRQQIQEKLGFTPYLGTLNLKLDAENASNKKLLEGAETIKICPEEGYCVGNLFKASVRNIECAIIIPQIKNYPKKVIEIISPKNLREELSLKDEDEITVDVQI
jgi:riboflavin kinase, archaea type